MNEVISLRVEGAPEGLDIRAAIVRMPGEDQPWNIFIEAAETDWWMSIGEVLVPPKGGALVFETEQSAELSAKLSVLLGWGWGDVWERTEEVLAWNQMALDSLGPNISVRIAESSVQDMIAYRDKMESMTIEAGEVIWQDLTGVNPDVGRN